MYITAKIQCHFWGNVLGLILVICSRLIIIIFFDCAVILYIIRHTILIRLKSGSRRLTTTAMDPLVGRSLSSALQVGFHHSFVIIVPCSYICSSLLLPWSAIIHYKLCQKFYFSFFLSKLLPFSLDYEESHCWQLCIEFSSFQLFVNLPERKRNFAND